MKASLRHFAKRFSRTCSPSALRWLCGIGLLTVIGLPATARADTATFVVGTAGCYSGAYSGSFSTIQAAVNAAGSSPATIIVCDGTYQEQVVVSHASNLTIEAENQYSAVVEPPPGTPTTSIAGPVIHVVNSSEVTIAGLTVTGENNFSDQCNPGDDRIAGIRYDDSSGTISDNRIVDIKHTDPAYYGCQEGNAVWVASDSGGPYRVEITDNIITNYQKDGIVVNMPGSSATISGNSIRGFGRTYSIAQNGIQFGFGASGEVRNNWIKNDWYSGASWTAGGIILFDVNANKIRHSLNKFSGVQRRLSVVTSQACPEEHGGFYQNYNLCPY